MGLQIPRVNSTLGKDLVIMTYNDSAAKNPRHVAEESGPFGRNRTRTTGSTRLSRTRTGTTPVRQKENPTIAEFGRLFAKEQQRDEDEHNKTSAPSTAGNPPQDAPRLAEPAAVATECMLYGYASKESEWKVVSKYERIVNPGYICEDYPREDPILYLAHSNTFSNSQQAVVVHRNLTQDAIRKSRTYRGGKHWIKVTFDSYQAAERACFYSPVEIDGHQVSCEMWQGKPPTDVPQVTDSNTNKFLEAPISAAGTMPSRTGSIPHNPRAGLDSALAGFAAATQTLPRGFQAPEMQYGKPEDDTSISSSHTASSATATGMEYPKLPEMSEVNGTSSALRSRSTPNLPTQTSQPIRSNQMTAIPTAKRMVLRPISEALPPQRSVSQRVLDSIPVVSWFAGNKAKGGDLIVGDGPRLREDGTWDAANNSMYWELMHTLDQCLGTDFCGLKDD